MNGTHRGRGIWIADGDRRGDGPAPPPAHLARVAPWLATAMGLAWPDPADPSGSRRPDAVVYDADEEAMVAERLRALGYLE